MSEWIEAIKFVTSLPQPNTQWGAATKQDLAGVQQQIATLIDANALWFGLAIGVATVAAIGVLALAWWTWRLRRQVKEILATRVQMKDCSGQLIMDVPLELLKSGYKFTAPQAVLNDVMKQPA